jgi:hypothetical protein
MSSLHLNLADDYRKLEALAQKSLSNLADDSYGRMIRRGIESLGAKL